MTSRHEPRYKQIADMLRALRTERRITQEELARRMDMTLSGYRPYEQGKRNLKIEQIPQFAAALGVPISEIAGRLWPEDVKLVETRVSTDLATAMAQVAHLPPEQQERILRGLRNSLEIAYGAPLVSPN